MPRSNHGSPHLEVRGSLNSTQETKQALLKTHVRRRGDVAVCVCVRVGVGVRSEPELERKIP